MPIGIAYVDGPRLARSVYAAADWVAAGRDEINRLNVFPVPDGDTGTNFTLTVTNVTTNNLGWYFAVVTNCNNPNSAVTPSGESSTTPNLPLANT